MKIVASNVVGIIYVVAKDETQALERFDNDIETFTDLSAAIDHENFERKYGSMEDMNTYKVMVTAEKVH